MASLLNNIAPAYNPTESYSFGAKILNNDHLYQCNKPTTGTFDPDAWTEIYLSDLIQGGVSMDGLEPELLWENTTQLSSFAAQSITIDVSKFKAVFVEFKCYSGTASYLYVDLSKTNQPVMGYYPDNPKTRGLTINGNTFTFTDALFKGSTTNNDLIPIRVYGIKDVVVNVIFDVSNYSIASGTTITVEEGSLYNLVIYGGNINSGADILSASDAFQSCIIYIVKATSSTIKLNGGTSTKTMMCKIGKL